MYWNSFGGGHDATAVSSLSATWRFAEGFTGGDFETYFLLANVSGATVSTTLNFFLDNGSVISKRWRSRRTAAARSASATTPSC